LGKSVIKASGCSISFSAKEKEPKRKLPAGALFYGPVNARAWPMVPNKPMPVLER
jgi:hypothetical protein